tara:strand:+ start:11210 stop:11617 length:408 start_codon:yes stop_codon:yes gene_type:complete
MKKGLKLSLYRPSDWMVYALCTSLAVGQIEQWSGFYNINVWLVHFLFTLIALSLFVIMAEKEFLLLTQTERRALYYLSVATTVWYFQKIYSLKMDGDSGYAISCKRDLLLVTTVVGLSLLTMSVLSVFTTLVFLT